MLHHVVALSQTSRAVESEESALERAVGATRQRESSLRSATLSGVCVEVEAERALVEYERVRGRLSQTWLECLQQAEVQAGDRVLLAEVRGSDEPVVVGVLGRRRSRREEQTVQLAAGQTLRIEGSRGQTLLTLREGERGPVVRLAGDDVELVLDGALRIEAEGIDLRARSGPVHLESSGDDVVARGKLIRLN